MGIRRFYSYHNSSVLPLPPPRRQKAAFDVAPGRRHRRSRAIGLLHGESPLGFAPRRSRLHRALTSPSLQRLPRRDRRPGPRRARRPPTGVHDGRRFRRRARGAPRRPRGPRERHPGASGRPEPRGPRLRCVRHLRTRRMRARGLRRGHQVAPRRVRRAVDNRRGRARDPVAVLQRGRPVAGRRAHVLPGRVRRQRREGRR